MRRLNIRELPAVVRNYLEFINEFQFSKKLNQSQCAPFTNALRSRSIDILVESVVTIEVSQTRMASMVLECL